MRKTKIFNFFLKLLIHCYAGKLQLLLGGVGGGGNVPKLGERPKNQPEKHPQRLRPPVGGAGGAQHRKLRPHIGPQLTAQRQLVRQQRNPAGPELPHLRERPQVPYVAGPRQIPPALLLPHPHQQKLRRDAHRPTVPGPVLLGRRPKLRQQENRQHVRQQHLPEHHAGAEERAGTSRAERHGEDDDGPAGEDGQRAVRHAQRERAGVHEHAESEHLQQRRQLGGAAEGHRVDIAGQFARCPTVELCFSRL